jgi:hypothetical protein
MFKFGDVDKGYDATKARLEAIKSRRVTVGIHGKDDDRADGPTNVDVGTWLEFGTDTSPERSFLRKALDKHQAEYVTYTRELSGQVVDGKLTIERALGLLGERVKADVVRMFDTNQIRPDITEATKRRKGSSTVGIDTASLKQSIDYLVRQMFDRASS